MVPKVVLISLIAGYLYLSLLRLHRFKKSSPSLLQVLHPRILPVSAMVNVRFTTNGMCVKNNTHVARTSRNKMSAEWDFYFCLVRQCESLHTCSSAFPITTKWCFDLDVKVVSGTTFTKRTCNRCSSLQKRGDVVATSQLTLH